MTEETTDKPTAEEATTEEKEQTAIVSANASDLTEEEKIAISKMPPLPILDNATVLVKKPEDIEKGQAILLEWAANQIRGVETELEDARANLAKATSRKWATSGWKRQVTLWAGRLNYYTKLRSAVEQGYFIMPDLPFAMEVFAVRTDQKHVSEVAHSLYGHSYNRLSDIAARNLPEGEGRFVDPVPFSRQRSHEFEERQKDGTTRTRTNYTLKATGIDTTIDFPVKAVRPQILEEVDKAVLAKTFDELGIIMPRTGSTRRRGTGPDPIVVGRIIRKEKNQTIGCSFIIHWYVDTRDL